MNVKLVRVKLAKLARLKVDEELLDEVGRVVVDDVLNNIATQQQADGAQIKSNSPGWLAKKRKHGLGDKSLVAAGHRLVHGAGRGDVRSSDVSFEYKADVEKALVEIIPSERAMAPKRIVKGFDDSTRSPEELSGYVQAKGYLGWFDISKKGMSAIRASVRSFINRQIRIAAQAGEDSFHA